MALVVYVDDIILALNSTTASKAFKDYLSECFNTKDLGPLKYFLNIVWLMGPKECSFVSESMPLKSSMSMACWEQNLLSFLLRKATS